VKKPTRKFEAIPVVEVLKKATEIHVQEPAKKVSTRKEPDATHSRNRPSD
jgi:hypothetical protein